MLQWEKNYLEVLIDTLRPCGDVLEVGFRGGYAAELIEKFHPKSHTIIEPNAERAKKWAKRRPNVTVVEGVWREALFRLGVFDAIFFDVREEDLIQEVLQPLTKIRYSEGEVDLFCKQVEKSAHRELNQFLYELEHNGQISSELRKKMAKKYRLKGAKKKIRSPMGQVLSFFEECLRSHVRKGSRLSCFLSEPTSRYEDSLFAEKIIVDPFLDYKEWVVPAKGSPHKEALVILLEKL